MIKLQLIHILSYVDPVDVFLPNDYLCVLIIREHEQANRNTQQQKQKWNLKLLYMQVGPTILFKIKCFEDFNGMQWRDAAVRWR